MKEPAQKVAKTDNPNDKLKAWFEKNIDLINLTGWERRALLSRTTLRQVSSGKRILTSNQQQAVTKHISFELVEFINIIQEIEQTFPKKESVN